MKIHTTNNEKLTEQILTLPRQFWPMDLKNNRILQGKGATTTRKDRDEDISVSTIIVPKLTVMPDDIVRTCKTIQPKEQSKINQMIGFLNLQSYLKKEQSSLSFERTLLILKKITSPNTDDLYIWFTK